MGWSGLSLVTDAEIGALEPEAIAVSAPWGATTWASQRSLAKRDLKVLLEIAYPEIPGVADKVLDRWAPDYAFAFTGAVYADRTSEVSDDEEEDLDLSAVFTTVADDRLYIGAAWEFDGLFVKLLDSLNANASTLTAKYWGAAGWTSLSATDGTIATATKTLSGTGRITWTLPTAWERRTLNGTGDEYYWVEVSVSAALTAGTAASQILPIKAPDPLKTVAQYFALMHIFRGLSAQAANADYWLNRAKDYEDRARALFSTLKDTGAIPLDTNSDDVIEPTTETAQPRPVRLYRG